jgi:RHH-type transcriptional regulator, rel operon repressor / antitoxin RelB
MVRTGDTIGCMAASAVVTLRLKPSLKRELDKLAQSTRRSQSRLAAEAIRQYIDVNRWQVEHVSKAIQQAEREDFLSDREVEAMFRKLTRRRARWVAAAV